MNGATEYDSSTIFKLYKSMGLKELVDNICDLIQSIDIKYNKQQSVLEKVLHNISSGVHCLTKNKCDTESESKLCAPIKHFIGDLTMNSKGGCLKLDHEKAYRNAILMCSYKNNVSNKKLKKILGFQYIA